MNAIDLHKTLQYFGEPTFGEYMDLPGESPEPVKYYYHKGDYEYEIIVFDDTNEVYQIGTENDIVGVELKTFEALKIRFESFVGEKIEDITADDEEEQQY